MLEFLKRNDKEKPWYEQKWARDRRLVIRPDVPGADYDPPDFSHLFDTEEKRDNFSQVVSTVIADTLSPEGPQWARGLTEEQLKQPLDINQLLAEFEAERRNAQERLPDNQA